MSNLDHLGENSVFSSAEVNVVDDERRMIDKVFAIVDKDNSGSIDAEELQSMFQLFGVETHYLNSAVSRVLQNTDKDNDQSISPEEFQKLLSQRFEKGDSIDEMKDLFNRVSERKDDLGVDQLHKVAQMLGESMSRSDINQMMKDFKKMYTKWTEHNVEDCADLLKRVKPEMYARPDREMTTHDIISMEFPDHSLAQEIMSEASKMSGKKSRNSVKSNASSLSIVSSGETKASLNISEFVWIMESEL